MTETETETLLSQGAVIQGMVMGSEPSAADPRISQVRISVRFEDDQTAEFSEELPNLYQPAQGSTEARRIAEVRQAQQLRHADRIPKIQLPLSDGERVPSVTTPRTAAGSSWTSRRCRNARCTITFSASSGR